MTETSHPLERLPLDIGSLSETVDTHTASLGVHMEPAEEFVVGMAASLAFGEETEAALIVTAQIEF